MHRTLTLIGRVLYALAFIGFGVYHFMYGAALATLVPSYFQSTALYMVWLVGIVFIWAAVTLLLNHGMRYSLTALSALLAVFILTIHLPNVINGNGALPFVLKDSALLGATLFMIGATFPKEHPRKHEAAPELE